tara:strand:+ start:2727 stop:3149 length:423 start_codon:yes stop_codon:yes gene_type:complete
MKSSRIHQRINEIGDSPRGAARILGMLAKREAGRRSGIRNIDDTENLEGMDRAVDVANKSSDDHNQASDQISKVTSYMKARLSQDEPPDSPKAGKAAIRAYRGTKRALKAEDFPTGKRKRPVSKSMDKFRNRTQSVSRKN